MIAVPGLLTGIFLDTEMPAAPAPPSRTTPRPRSILHDWPDREPGPWKDTVPCRECLGSSPRWRVR